MAAYRLFYKVAKKGQQDLGELQQSLEAPSDDQARVKARRLMQAFRDNAEAGMTYRFVRVMRELD